MYHPKIILWDFTTCKLDTVLPTFQQYVSCYTRGDKKLDLCYGNIKEAYRSLQKPPVGTSDHFAVQLHIQTKAETREGEAENSSSVVWWGNPETAGLFFACTDWQVVIQDHSIEQSVTAGTSYIQYCESMLIPTKTVKCYPNNKPWLTTQLKRAIQAKRRAFATGAERMGEPPI